MTMPAENNPVQSAGSDSAYTQILKPVEGIEIHRTYMGARQALRMQPDTMPEVAWVDDNNLSMSMGVVAVVSVILRHPESQTIPASTKDFSCRNFADDVEADRLIGLGRFGIAAGKRNAGAALFGLQQNESLRQLAVSNMGEVVGMLRDIVDRSTVIGEMGSVDFFAPGHSGYGSTLVNPPAEVPSVVGLSFNKETGDVNTLMLNDDRMEAITDGSVPLVGWLVLGNDGGVTIMGSSAPLDRPDALPGLIIETAEAQTLTDSMQSYPDLVSGLRNALRAQRQTAESTRDITELQPQVADATTTDNHHIETPPAVIGRTDADQGTPFVIAPRRTSKRPFRGRV